MKRILKLTVIATLFLAITARADEQTREVQEELRQRHIFYGDIDGQMTPTLAAALQHYQERKHLAATGTITDETLKSLGIWSAAPPAQGPAEPGDLPDVAVLKSDQRVPQKGDILPSLGAATLEPVAFKSPALTRQEAQTFIRSYFSACQSRNVDEELKFYGDRVNYYDHGTVDRNYIRNELVVYDQHWPIRQYVPGESVKLTKQRDNAVARFRTAFNVSDPLRFRQARGRTNNLFEITRGPDSRLHIVSIHESRVRAKGRRPINPVAGIARRVGGFMRGILP